MYKTILVNKENKIKENYLKKLNLISTTDIDNEDVQVEIKTYEAYLELKEFLESKNIIIGIASAFRTLEEQQKIYDRFQKKYGKDYADKVVAPVGGSEHHTGLAIDLSIYKDNKFLIENKDLLQEKETFKVIHKYLSDFGFILRYQEEKEPLTGYPYEPWHIRYVGKLPAKIIAENNWSLEEYLKEFSALIVINKEKDMTSFDVVNEISHQFGIKRVGHTGTLDPLAEGVLIVAIGKYTKLVELITAEDKEYIATVNLGIETDTKDITGKIINESEIPDNLEIEKALKFYQKTYLQEVPIYSAVKVAGKKLYEYARNNQTVELPKKEVTIKNIELLQQEKDSFTFKTSVTKGCYIRSLITDICSYLNVAGTMSNLIRTRQGTINIEKSYTLEEIKNNNFKFLDIKEVLPFPIVKVNKELEIMIKNGRKLKNNWNITNKVIFYTEDDKLLGIYQVEEDTLKVWKNF